MRIRLSEEWIVRDASDIGRAIRHFRDEQGLIQEDLAMQSAIHRSYLSDLERGHATAHTDRLLRVLRRLGLEIVIRRRP